MYGTIARVQTSPDKVSELRALARSMDTAPGQIGRYVFRMDADPGELWLVGIFESKDAYWANAHSPEQHQRFMDLRALLSSDPEWHDGEIVDAAMSERNAVIVRRVYDEVINGEQKDVIDEIFAADVVVHDPIMGTNRGVAVFHKQLGMFDAAFPHHRVSVEEIVSQGDLVCVLHTHTATHTGPFLGKPPTGKTVVVNGIELFRLRDDKIVEFWRKDDYVSLLMQLGMLPMPQAT